MTLSVKNKKNLLIGIANFQLVIGSIFLFIHLLAPVLGGKILYSSLVLYGSWIGFSLSIKFNVQDFTEMTPRSWGIILIFWAPVNLLIFGNSITTISCSVISVTTGCYMLKHGNKKKA